MIHENIKNTDATFRCHVQCNQWAEWWADAWFLPCDCMYCNARYCCRNFVRPSVKRVYCDKTKWWTADILVPHDTAIPLVFWHQQWLVGDASFPLKSALKVTHPFEKRRLRRISAHNFSTVRDSKKKFNYDNIKSTMGFPTSYRCSTLRLSPERVAQRAIFLFSWVKVNGWWSQALST